MLSPKAPQQVIVMGDVAEMEDAGAISHLENNENLRVGSTPTSPSTSNIIKIRDI